ncbi:hypothetical protein ACFL08_05400 [Patescibacteria group bacterium]
MKCSKDEREKCLAYTYKMGCECWMIAGSVTKNPSCAHIENCGSCLNCPWYKKMNAVT